MSGGWEWWGGRLTKDSISQETQQNKNSTYCLCLLAECWEVRGQPWAIVPEKKWLHNSQAFAYKTEKKMPMGREKSLSKTEIVGEKPSVEELHADLQNDWRMILGKLYRKQKKK